MALMDILTGLMDRLAIGDKVRHRRALEQEKWRLDCSTPPLRPPANAEMVLFHERKAVWKVPCAGAQDAFVSLEPSASDADRYLVHVDAERFYRMWLNRAAALNDPARADACVLLSDMPKDYKYPHAADGFAQGRANPVPLAECLCQRAADGTPQIFFDNGVTRTFWLLANGAMSFPIVVRSREAADLLHQEAGNGPGPQAIDGVFLQARGLKRHTDEQHPVAPVQKPVRAADPSEPAPTPRSPRL